ncbi:MAG TPA: hypothetical protein VHQ66_13450, partial [Myxococcota bacterium]|nr:hypothetical protein [Myxococcota bacterium]
RSQICAAVAAAALAGACALLGPRPVPPDALAELAGRAERARGLRFEAPIDARVVSPRRLRGLLADELDAGLRREDFARAEAVGQALGLFPPAFDLRAALLELQADTVAGFYTPLRQRLVLVVDGSLDAALASGVDQIAVHELVHALQDSHTQLLAVLLGLDDHDDLAFALGALLEGDAVLAAFRDREARGGRAVPTPAEYARGFAGEPEDGEAALPRFLRESYLQQYPLGYAYASALVQEGGADALDAALRDPPLSSEALLDFAAAHAEGRRAASPPALPFLDLDPATLGCGANAALGRNTFGELGLQAFAAERGASRERAAAAADGWDGDRAVALACGAEEAAFAWLVQLDTELDAAELATLAASTLRPGETIEREGRRVLLARGLAPDARRAALAAPARSFASLDAYLAARPGILERAARLRRVAGPAARP